MRRSLARHALALCLTLGWLTGCSAMPDRAGASARAAACQPEKRVDLPLSRVRTYLLAPATLDGHAATLLLDTGSETSTITPRMAATLHLRPDRGHATTLAGVAGNVRSAELLLPRLALGGTVVATARSIGIGALPASVDGLAPPVAGLLGADVLSQFDVELDARTSRMRLYTPSPCADFRPWPAGASARFQRTRTGLVFLDVTVDGKPMRALLDTGADVSLMTPRAARTLGVTRTMLAADLLHIAIGPRWRQPELRLHRFASLGIPGALEQGALVNIGDLRLPGVDLLLGAEYLAHRDIWISYATGRLFVR